MQLCKLSVESAAGELGGGTATPLVACLSPATVAVEALTRVRVPLGERKGVRDSGG